MTGIAIAAPLVLGILTTACTIVVQGLAVSFTLHFVRRQHALGRAGVAFWADLGIVGATMMIALAAHLSGTCLWASLFLQVGEFEAFGTAFYHSSVNYTTLGYGDLPMSPAWKMLAPIEAIDGLLMFGVSTALIFAVMRRLIRIRFLETSPGPGSSRIRDEIVVNAGRRDAETQSGRALLMARRLPFGVRAHRAQGGNRRWPLRTSRRNRW